MSSESPTCFHCHLTPEDIDYSMFKEPWQSHDEYVLAEEGTYCKENNKFLCDACYIRLGQPSSPEGWVASDRNMGLLYAKMIDEIVRSIRKKTEDD